MSIKSPKNCENKRNNRRCVDKLTNCLEIRRIAKIFFCPFAQINQINIRKIAKKRKIYELGIDILKKTLYNGYNHRNGVMGRSVFFFRKRFLSPRK